MSPNRPVSVRLWIVMLVTALFAGAGAQLASRYLDDETAAQVEIAIAQLRLSAENQDGLICVVGNVAGGLVSIVDEDDRPAEVEDLDDLLVQLQVDEACARFIASLDEPPP